MKKLKENWVEFFRVFFSPWFVLIGLITIAAIIFSILFKDNQLFSNLLTILGGITGGISGGVFQNEYNKNSGQEILEKKGQSAVRNLQSIQKQMNSLKECVAIFIKKNIGESKNQLEEIFRHISTMELCVGSGYEDWIDIVPQLSKEKEAQEKIYDKYEEISRSLVDELLDQRMKLYKSANAAEKEELGKKVSQLEKQIRGLKGENNSMVFASSLNNNAFKIRDGINVLSSEPGYLSSTLGKVCSSCGKSYEGDLYGTFSSLCPGCRNKLSVSGFGVKL